MGPWGELLAQPPNFLYRAQMMGNKRNACAERDHTARRDDWPWRGRDPPRHRPRGRRRWQGRGPTGASPSCSAPCLWDHTQPFRASCCCRAMRWLESRGMTGEHAHAADKKWRVIRGLSVWSFRALRPFCAFTALSTFLCWHLFVFFCREALRCLQT